jgi:hypothetical protein
MEAFTALNFNGRENEQHVVPGRKRPLDGREITNSGKFE